MKEATQYRMYLGLLAALFFIPFLGGVHLFDWDEINFAEISREMLITGEYFRPFIDYQAFYQKPPLFFWLQAAAMQTFGVNEFAARFPNAICGIITIILLYNLGRKLYDHRFGLLWAMSYFGSVLPFLYFKSGIIDPYFNLFIFLGIYFFILFYWKKEALASIDLSRKQSTYLILAGVFIGLGILTKGPVAYLVAGLVFAVYWIYKRFQLYISIPQFLLYTLIVVLVTGTWFGLETLINGPEFLEEFFTYQVRLLSTPDAGHRGFPGYHFVVLLLGCFPASIFAIRVFFQLPEEEKVHQSDFLRWMKYLFWVVLILFSLVNTKIVHYSSLCYFPLTFLAALVLYKIVDGTIDFSRNLKIGLWIIAGLYSLVLILVPILGQQIDLLRPLIKDPFALGNLEAAVHWSGLEVLPGIFLLSLLGFSLYQTRFNTLKGFLTLFGGMGIFIMLTLYFFIARIEAYSQRAAVEFFEERIGEDCYVESYAYKTYVKLFYSRKPPVENPKSYEMEWLLNGPIDKDVYIITKIHKTPLLEPYEELKEIGRKNGFVFYKRNRKLKFE